MVDQAQTQINPQSRAQINPQAQTQLNPQSQQWTASTSYINKIGYVTLNLQNCTQSILPALFIIAVDISGSMSGNPINQVNSALNYIYNISHNNPLMKIILITYNNHACTIPLTVNIKLFA